MHTQPISSHSGPSASKTDEARQQRPAVLLSQLRETAFLRLPEIVGDRKRGIRPLLPVSRSSWLAGIDEGRYPRPVRLGRRAVAWRGCDLADLVDRLNAGGA